MPHPRSVFSSSPSFLLSPASPGLVHLCKVRDDGIEAPLARGKRTLTVVDLPGAVEGHLGAGKAEGKEFHHHPTGEEVQLAMRWKENLVPRSVGQHKLMGGQERMFSAMYKDRLGRENA